ncbi:MAG: hypothetical protein ACI8P9_001249 [Parasphingorhabdus sp.]|jgi:hypothetical protein
MTVKTPAPIHWSFWLIGSIAFFWNGIGAINFFLQMNPEMIASYRESERAIIVDRPLWATIGFAIAVFGGTLGSVLMILRRSAALSIFIASLVGVIVTMAHTLSLDVSFGTGELLGIILMPILVAAQLVWYSRKAQELGWLR